MGVRDPHEGSAWDSLPLLLTFEEAARLCGVSRRSISRAVQAGDLRVVQAPGTTSARGYRVPLDQVLAYIRRMQEETQKAIKRIRERRDRRAGRWD